MDNLSDSVLTVALPDIGEGVVEGEVIAWLKQVGDELKQDEPVVVVMTDKATVELPAPKPGILQKQYKSIGEFAIKDKPLYDIMVSGGSAFKPSGSTASHQSPSESSAFKSTPSEMIVCSEKALASPATRCLAKEEGIDIQALQGTGKHGRVTKEDVLKSKTPITPIHRFEGDREEPLSGIRQLMADKMTESCRVIPHFSYFSQADMTRLVRMRKKFAEEGALEGIKVTFVPFFLKAMSKCIDKYPLLNSSLDDRKRVLVIHKPHNLGVAMAAPFGLIVPVIKGVQSMGLRELITAYAEIKQKAFENRLSSGDMKEGTLTLTNFGALPGMSMGGTPIINYPEAAICGVARIQKMPKVVNDAIVIRELMNVSFSFDHRIIDGQMAAEISQTFCTLLENPAQLL